MPDDGQLVSKKNNNMEICVLQVYSCEPILGTDTFNYVFLREHPEQIQYCPTTVPPLFFACGDVRSALGRQHVNLKTGAFHLHLRPHAEARVTPREPESHRQSYSHWQFFSVLREEELHIPDLQHRRMHTLRKKKLLFYR